MRLVGDLNAKHDPWNRELRPMSYNFALNSNVVIIHPNKATHFPHNGMSSTYIDLAVYKKIRGISDLEAISDLSSDHDPITVILRNHIT